MAHVHDWVVRGTGEYMEHEHIECFTCGESKPEGVSVMVKCGHGVWPGTYCDPCEREFLDRMDAVACRTSHDGTPMMPVVGSE